ncbi:hypothetical protein ACLNGM_10115 [Aureimonas phyllosphaerae]|uniref:hypothetical protein n=1 Tax=Aureimonas phyllosphaerae TaxID=1166078 RepID=UPI003A5C3A31
MSLTTDQEDAAGRLDLVNDSPFDEINNPYGLSRGGNSRGVFVRALRDLVTLVRAAVGFAETATTQASSATASASAAASSATQAAASAERFQGTSTSNVTPGLGSRTFFTQTNKAFTIGTNLLIQSRGQIASWMFGKVTAYNSSTGSLTVSVEAVGAATARTDWDILVTGARGIVGPDSWASPVAWDAGVTYSATPPRSTVTYDGETYVATVTHTSGATFNAANWIKIAARGTQLTKATGTDLRALTDDAVYLTPKVMADAMKFFNTGASTTITPDFGEAFNRVYLMGLNATLGQPLNMKDGEPIVLYFLQDATGGRTLSFNATYHKFAGGIVPTLSTAPTAVDRLSGICRQRSGGLVVEWGSLERDLK